MNEAIEANEANVALAEPIEAIADTPPEDEMVPEIEIPDLMGESPPADREVRMIPIASIVTVQGFNARDQEHVDDVGDLVESIRQQGILVPLTVTRGGPDGADEFLLVAGQRRLTAARQLGLEEVPALVLWAGATTTPAILDTPAAIEAMMTENLAREDLDPLEEAEGYRRLVGLGLSQRQLAKRLPRTQSHISKRLQLLELPANAQTELRQGKLPIADALELTRLGSSEEVQQALKEGRRPRWTIKEAVDQLLKASAERRAREEAYRLAKEKGWRLINGKGIQTNDGMHVWAMTEGGKRAVLPGQEIQTYGSNELRADVPWNQHEASHPSCHAVGVTKTGQIVHICTNRAAHEPKVKTDDREAARRKKEQEAERRQAAERMRVFKDILAARGPAESTWAAQQVLSDHVAQLRAPLAELLGLEAKTLEAQIDQWLLQRSTGSGQVLLAIALARAARACGPQGWDSDERISALRILKEHGYEPTKPEQKLLERGLLANK